jgi:hypothetical protein
MHASGTSAAARKERVDMHVTLPAVPDDSGPTKARLDARRRRFDLQFGTQNTRICGENVSK